MKKILIVSIFIVLALPKSYAQHSFGAEFGTFNYAYYGRNIVMDSIAVVTNSNDRGGSFGGIFYEMNIKNRFSIYTKILFRNLYIGNEVYNVKTPYRLGPNFSHYVIKGTTNSIRNLSVEVVPKWRLLSLDKFNLCLIGGLNVGINFKARDSPDVVFAYGRHPAVAEVINAIKSGTFKPFTFSLVYGVVLEYWRLLFTVKWETPATYADKLKVRGQEYDYKNSWEFFSFSVGFRLFPLKGK